MIPDYDTDVPCPYVFLAEEGFTLKPHMLGPYSQRKETYDVKEGVFNYRLSEQGG